MKTQESGKPVAAIQPTSLASFISIARSEMRSHREKRLNGLLLWIAGGLVLCGAPPTQFRWAFVISGIVIFAFVNLGVYLQSYSLETHSGQLDLGHLLRFLNYNRAKQGLDGVVGQDMLAVLEGEARVWEQIESGLQSEGWKSQEELRARIQQNADRSMTELVALGTCPGSLSEYRSWHEEWDANVGKLRSLLRAMHEAEQVLFAYPRVSGLSSEAPAPETPGIENLERILAL